jgi:sorbitol/mannitol transport system substrate-binding protein
MTRISPLLAATSALTIAAAAGAQEVTIATVNNGDMIIMQGMTDKFNEAYPDITLNWVTLEENILRERVTTDIATGGGQYDVMTIGALEAPLWAEQGWLEPLEFDESYNVDDLLPSIRASVSVDGNLYAAPFYGESAMTMYRTDLLEAAGIEMPEDPTWDFIGETARAITDRNAEINGICLRGKAGWGENMGFITALANSFGARYFDEDWNPQFDSQEWHDALQFYVDLMADAGPAGASSNGFNENLTLFQQGKCGMWMDATVAAGWVSDPEQSTVGDSVDFALFPHAEGVDNHGNWLWAWSLAIPASSDSKDAAKTFVQWATSTEYAAAVAEKLGWAAAPPGTRTSLYENPDYLEVASFAEPTLEAINAANTQEPTVEPVPYTGGQLVVIPEWQAIGTQVGQLFAAVVAGQSTVDDALAQAQSVVTREMTRAGYIQ